ncbi:PLC-like phosphodiesterase [Bisporella sp. PMI_857]|nr:PLC-like phosphodiesterase [Bisporella sp. PMI_857]
MRFSSFLPSFTSLTGASEARTPTGNYLRLSSTITLRTSIPVSTEALVSTISSGSTTVLSTYGSTTIFDATTATIVGNSTESTTTPSQTFLQGSNRPTTSIVNGTSNATSASTSAQPTNTRPCNNYAEFCERKYGNITEVATHNSPFVKAGNAAANQALPVTTQLNDGVRMLQGQMHIVNGIPYFCHTSCDVLNSGPITTYLGQVKEWVDDHPFDVVTILLGNGNYSKVTDYSSFIEETGIVKYAYVPDKIPMGINDWPTLAQMILGGKRVIIFMDYEANQTAVPWILDEFSQVWETPFDPTDRNFPCTVQRPPDLSETDAKNRLYIVNHNLNYDINILGNGLLVPNIPLLNITNNVTGFGSLGTTATGCTAQWGYPPKFLNVDYYNVGNGSVFEVAANLNNVTYTRECCGLPASGAKSLQVASRGSLVAAFVVVIFSWTFL